MQALDATAAESAVHCGASVDALRAIARPGVELALWRRRVAPTWPAWLHRLSHDSLPSCRLEVALRGAAGALHASCDASRTPGGPQRQAHDGGIVHGSPRIAGTGIVRLVLVLDPPPSHHRERPLGDHP